MNLNPFGFDSVEEFLFSFIVTLFGTLLLPSTAIGYAVWFAAKQRKTAAVAAVIAGIGLLLAVKFSCVGPVALTYAIAEVSHRLLFGGWAPGKRKFRRNRCLSGRLGPLRRRLGGNCLPEGGSGR